MARALVDPANSIWRNALGVVAVAILLPIALIVKLITLPFERPTRRSAEQVAQELTDIINCTGGERAIDDFVSVPIADPQLDSIRVRFADLELPFTEEGLSTVRSLLTEAEALAEADRRGR